jgi:hypothetical protein
MQRRAWRQTKALWYWLARRHFNEVDWRSDAYGLANRDVERQMKEAGMSISGSAWQHDHIRPLIEANGDLTFWQLDNIQTLCTACHVAKTADDNRRIRASRLNIAPQSDLFTK